MRAALSLLIVAGGCIAGQHAIRTWTGLEDMEMTSLEIGDIVLPGSRIVAKGQSFGDESVGEATVRFDGLVDGRQVRIAIAPTYVGASELEVRLTDSEVAAFGQGRFTGEVSVVYTARINGAQFQSALPAAFQVRANLEPEVAEVQDGAAHLNDLIIVRGGGFLDEGEGTTLIVLDGKYTTESGAAESVQDLAVAASLAERNARDRTLFPFPTAAGGIEPGRFVGRVRARNSHSSGEILESASVDVTFDIGRPEIFGVDPTTATIGQVLHVRGAGFVGGEEGDEVTIIRLDGTFVPANGAPVDVDGREIVPAFGSGQELRYSILPRALGSSVVALDFNASEGVFEGTMTPIITKGTTEVVGESRSIEFALGGIKQVVWVRFLPGFSDSIRLFGLHAVEQEIISRVFDKFTRVYAGTNVEFRRDEPTDYDVAGYARLEIGGPDPNGQGLFGYDNTPGKDIGNVRLNDWVGGTNAAGAQDGYGYGGVFIESFMYFSDHPPFTGSRPPSSPPPEADFDRIFDPVRDREVTAGDWPNGERESEVDKAIQTLANLIGDTASHEFGHSLGLALPYGLATQYHNTFDMPGCLMDAGGDRPFGERAELEGFDFGHFCGEEITYLQQVLAAAR